MGSKRTPAFGVASVVAGVVLGICATVAGPAGSVAAETPQQVIDRLQAQGYTVTIDRIGTGPINDCVVTGVRNPKKVTQWVPYVGPGIRDETVLVQEVVSQSISVSLDCSR
ncbi:hypothetical protein [Mycolicibacterium thermoresistibile]